MLTVQQKWQLDNKINTKQNNTHKQYLKKNPKHIISTQEVSEYLLDISDQDARKNRFFT